MAPRPDGSEACRRAREALGMTQAELAELLGVPQSTVGRWEAGIRSPGAVGLALFKLVEASPAAAKRVLARPAKRRRPR